MSVTVEQLGRRLRMSAANDQWLRVKEVDEDGRRLWRQREKSRNQKYLPGPSRLLKELRGG